MKKLLLAVVLAATALPAQAAISASYGDRQLMWQLPSDSWWQLVVPRPANDNYAGWYCSGYGWSCWYYDYPIYLDYANDNWLA